jgi:hypothetical protein
MTKMAACHVCKTIVACVEKEGQLLYRDHMDGDDMCEGSYDVVETNVVDHQPVEAKRVPVDYIYHQLNWDFIHGLAQIASYAQGKYGSVQQYADSRLAGEKSPVNHMLRHIGQYITGEEHDHFGNVESHLLAIAYNAMMEYFYYQTYGSEDYKLHVNRTDGPARRSSDDEGME